MNQHMDVIWHHAPRQQLVSLVVKMQQRVFGDFSNAGIAQTTCPNSAVQICLQLGALLTLILNFQQMLPFATT